VLHAPGGVLRLEGCRLGLPVRSAGPASTLQYRVSHPGGAADAQLELPLTEATVQPPPPETARPDPAAGAGETIDAVLERLDGRLRIAEEQPAAVVVPPTVVRVAAPPAQQRLLPDVLRRLRRRRAA
jgi:hypothetical protein